MDNEDYSDLIIDSFVMATEFSELCGKDADNGD